MLEEGALTLRFLGEVDVGRAGARLPLPPSKKTRALLAYLAVTGRPQRRAHLCSLLWDVADDPRGALRWSLSRLRPLVDGPDRRRLVAEGETVRFDGRDAHVDVTAVRRALARGAGALPTADLARIAGAFRGDFLEGLDLLDMHDFQAWCVAEREEARSLRGSVLRALIARLQHVPEQALPHARALVHADPLDEGARAGLVRLLWATRRHQEAEQHFLAGERLLSEPGARSTGELREAWSACREGRIAPEPAAPAGERTGSVERTAQPVIELAMSRPPQPVIEASAQPAALVGREAERAALLALLADVQARRGERVVLLTGEPGIGKSRMLAELCAAVRASGAAAIECRAHEAESGRPYGPWMDALRRLPREPLGEALRRDLAPLLGEPPHEAPETRERLFDAVAALIASLARGASAVLLVLDDLQWCDEASAQLLHYVVRTSRGQPLLVALAARGGELPDNSAALRVLRGFRRDPAMSEIRLGPLDLQGTRALAAHLCPGIDGDLVYTESGGNPLFAIEVTRAAPHRRDNLPTTLSRLVSDRLDRLPDDAIEVLRWGALLGRTFRAQQIERLLAIDFGRLASALETLERHDLLHGIEGEHAFVHDLVRRVVVAEVSEPRRRLMHGRIARALSEEGGASGPLAADIAHHAGLAGEHGMAARACVAAGRRCLRLFAHAGADALARRGMRHVEALAEPERVPLLLELHEISLSARRPDAVDQVASALEGLAERALALGFANHARLGFHLLAYLRWNVGAAADARRHMLRAEEVSRGAGEGERALALAETGRCLVLLERDLAEAEALLLEARALARRRSLDLFAISDALGLLGLHRGEIEEAAALFTQARAVAAREGDARRELEALEHLIALEQRRGRWAEALAHTPALIDLGGKLPEGSEAPFASALSALCEYVLSHPGAAARLDDALGRLRAVDAKCKLGYVLSWAADADLARGDEALARARAEEALRVAVLLERPSDVAWARALLVRACRGAEAEHHRERLREEASREISAHARRLARAELGERTRAPT